MSLIAPVNVSESGSTKSVDIFNYTIFSFIVNLFLKKEPNYFWLFL